MTGSLFSLLLTYAMSTLALALSALAVYFLLKTD